MAQAKILTRLVSQLKAKGFSQSAAEGIATSKLQASGNLQKGSQEPTAKGLKRGDMSPGDRAKDRASKTSGRPAASYKYDPKTNRATLK